jgi:hypothetical protein
VADVKRALGHLIKGAVVAAFVVCVECLMWRRRRAKRSEKCAVPAARLRVRRGVDRHVTFGIEGTLDPFAARMLACSVAQVPLSATLILDLSAAGPIRGAPLAIVARIFAAGRRVHLRGPGEGHEGLLALGPAPHSIPLALATPFDRSNDDGPGTELLAAA